MKQLICFICCATLLCIYSSCDLFTDCIRPEGTIETQTVELDEIDAFEIFGAFELIIKEGESQEIKITGHPNVIEALLEDSKIEEGTWDVGIKKCIANWRKKDLTIEATIPNLQRISVTGSADISTDGIFKNIDILALNIEGTGNMDLQLGDNIEKIGTQILGSGNVSLSGNSINSSIDIDGSGDINYFNLTTKSSTIKILGSGNCEVTATNLLDIKISGSGDLCFKGNPTISSNISGSGKVNDCN